MPPASSKSHPSSTSLAATAASAASNALPSMASTAATAPTLLPPSASKAAAKTVARKSPFSALIASTSSSLAAAALIALYWFLMPSDRRARLRVRIAVRLVQLAKWIGGPSFNPGPAPQQAQPQLHHASQAPHVSASPITPHHPVATPRQVPRAALAASPTSTITMQMPPAPVAPATGRNSPSPPTAAILAKPRNSIHHSPPLFEEEDRDIPSLPPRVPSTNSSANAGARPTSTSSTATTVVVPTSPASPASSVVSSSASRKKRHSIVPRSSTTLSVSPPNPYDVPPAPHRPHRHSGAIERSLAYLRLLEPLQVGEKTIAEAVAAAESGTEVGRWVPQGPPKAGVTIHLMEPLPGTAASPALPPVRGDGVIEGAFTLQEAYSVIRSSNCRRTLRHQTPFFFIEGDTRYDHGESIEHFNIDEALAYSVQKGTFPVAPRDLVTAVFNRRGDGTLRYVVTSVVDPTAPSEGRGRVRGNLAIAAWILRERAGAGGGIDATYIVDIDPRGNIPTSLVKLVQTQSPLCIAEVSRYLNSRGPIPFIVRPYSHRPPLTPETPGPDVVLMSEEYDDRTDRYEVDMTVRAAPPSRDGRRGVLAVALPRRGFSDGADVSVAVAPAGVADVRARLLRAPEDADVGLALRGVVGKATAWVLECWLDGGEGEEVEVEIRVERGRHGVVVNGEPVE
ncbi:hypothetical protein DFJ73DRAFT_932611 [Zopfochytrium polystomum]|nr:hypothetical protein DFJ73DRAFT_932611 [Zopfochytrium polystomum]